MASSVVNVEWQTSLVIHYLFEDEDDAICRQFDSQFETDGPKSTDDGFDPVQIADKLRRIGDALNENIKFREAMTDLKQAAAQETFDEGFSHCVEAVCESHMQSTLTAEVAPEVHLIQASVAFGLYVKKSSPELKRKVQSAVTAFLNRRVGTWIAKQGGWDKLPGV